MKKALAILLALAMALPLVAFGETAQMTLDGQTVSLRYMAMQVPEDAYCIETDASTRICFDTGFIVGISDQEPDLDAMGAVGANIVAHVPEISGTTSKSQRQLTVAGYDSSELVLVNDTGIAFMIYVFVVHETLYTLCFGRTSENEEAFKESVDAITSSITFPTLASHPDTEDAPVAPNTPKPITSVRPTQVPTPEQSSETGSDYDAMTQQELYDVIDKARDALMKYETYLDSDIVLLDHAYGKITLRSTPWIDYDCLFIEVIIENNSSRTVEYIIKNGYINGWSLVSFEAERLKPGKKVRFDFDMLNVSNANIETLSDIEEIEFDLNVLDDNTRESLYKSESIRISFK